MSMTQEKMTVRTGKFQVSARTTQLIDCGVSDGENVEVTMSWCIRGPEVGVHLRFIGSRAARVQYSCPSNPQSTFLHQQHPSTPSPFPQQTRRTSFYHFRSHSFAFMTTSQNLIDSLNLTFLNCQTLNILLNLKYATVLYVLF